MRGKKAKRIRKLVYGDQSVKQPRRYVRNSVSGVILNHPDSLRAKYQRTKRVIKEAA